MPSLKVLFIGSVYAPNGVGGAERTVQALAETLVRRGHSACVISLAPNGRGSTGELNGVRTYYVPLANLHWLHGTATRSALRRALWHLIDAYNPVMGARVGRILDIERPDVVQTGNLKGFSVAAWRATQKRHIPVVQMLHDYYLGCPNSAMFRRGVNCHVQCGICKAYSLPRRRLSNLPAAVISLSQRLLDRLEDCGLFPGVSRKEVIHGASSPETRTMTLRLTPREAQAPLTIGYLGRMEATKGVEVVIKATLQVPGRRLRLLLGGTGAPGYLNGLRSQYTSPDVQFIGFIEPADLFARIDLLVVPSLWEEPLGRVIYEAYEYGIPSIVSRAGGMPEIIEEGRTGFVVEPGNVTQLANLLTNLAADWQPERYRLACIAKSREFDVNRLIDRYLDVWRTAAGIARPDFRISSKHTM